MATPEENQQTTETATSASAEPKDPEENVLAHPDETTDVVLEVEGRELHASRAVLAHYSPVFRAMFFSHFKENSADKVPLPGKQFDTMVTFCNVLYPRSASAKCLINDGNLIDMLTLADEYQTDKVMTVCQDYIGDQLCEIFLHFYRYSVSSTPWSYQRNQTSCFGIPKVEPYRLTRGQKTSREGMTEKLTLYLCACEGFRLPSHSRVIRSLIVDGVTCLEEATLSKHYTSLPDTARIALLEELCSKFDQSRVFV